MDLTMDAPLDDSLGKYLPAVREDSPLYHPNVYPSAAKREEYKEERLAKKQSKTSEGIDDLPFDDDDLPF